MSDQKSTNNFLLTQVDSQTQRQRGECSHSHQHARTMDESDGQALEAASPHITMQTIGAIVFEVLVRMDGGVHRPPMGFIFDASRCFISSESYHRYLTTNVITITPSHLPSHSFFRRHRCRRLVCFSFLCFFLFDF